MRNILILTAFNLLIVSLYSQAAFQSEEEFEAQYNINIQKTHLDGIYIPQDLEDAFKDLHNLGDDETFAKFAAADELAVSKKLHFGIGRWIMVNWKFYTGSRFSHYLKEMGLLSPDHKAQFVIRSFHRHLNHKPLDSEALVKEFEEARKKELEPILNRRKIIKEETRKIKKEGQ